MSGLLLTCQLQGQALSLQLLMILPPVLLLRLLMQLVWASRLLLLLQLLLWSLLLLPLPLLPPLPWLLVALPVLLGTNSLHMTAVLPLVHCTLLLTGQRVTWQD